VDAEQQRARLSVPMDYRKPGGRTIALELSRVRAADPGKRRGVLLLNPGGPGGVSRDLAKLPNHPEFGASEAAVWRTYFALTA
jgi:hypothetical protein